VSKNAEQMALPGLAIFNSAFSMVDVGILKYVVELCFVFVGMCNGYGRYSALQCSTRFFSLSCAITPCLPASPSPSSKWDVKGSFVGKIQGKCCKARHPRGNHPGLPTDMVLSCEVSFGAEMTPGRMADECGATGKSGQRRGCSTPQSPSISSADPVPHTSGC
jgi:hypothetical protein